MFDSTQVVDAASASGQGSGSGLDTLVGAVADALAAVHDADLDAAHDSQVRDAVMSLEAVRAQAEAACARVVGELDARRLWADDGARNAQAWLRTTARVERGRASRLVRHSRHLRGLPATWAAHAAGRISPEVVARLVRLDNERTADALRRDEVDLVRLGEWERFDRFCQRLDEWELEQDPDGAFRDRPDSRRFHCSKTLGGSYALDGWLDPVSGTTFVAAFERIEKELFEADWAAAKERLGRDPLPHQLGRTPAQRRADTLVEMAERAIAAPAGARKPQPLITIVVGTDRFRRTCQTLDGTTLSPHEAAALLDDAVIERITFDGEDRPFKVSAQRTFRGALRRAIKVRDRECTHPCCDAPADRCEVDHIQPSAWDGPTSLDNGRLRCPFHNRARHGHRGPPDDDPPPR
jgi:hypothetical protein